MRQLLLQSGAGITKWDIYYKVQKISERKTEGQYILASDNLPLGFLEKLDFC